MRIATALVLFWVATFAVEAQITPPNIVVIMTDDQELASVADMPQVQARLVDEGVTFANAFVTTSMCCPARASILRGQNTHNHGVWRNLPSNGGGFPAFRNLGLEQSTLATWLEHVGYHTVLIGKYMNGYPAGAGQSYVPPGWAEWYVPISPFDLTYYGFKQNANGEIVEYGEDRYKTDVEADIAVDVIERATAPLFLLVSPWAPHKEIRSGGAVPPVPALRHQGLMADRIAPRGGSFNELDFSDKPLWMQHLNLYANARLDDLDELYRRRLESLLSVDEMVGRIYDALENKEILDNTFIVFLTDNGFHFGEHRLLPTKLFAYEEDIRIPLIVRGPGLPAGTVLSPMVLNIDLAPTFAEWAGATIPDFVDGRSFVPLLEGTAPSWRQAFLIERREMDPPEFFGPPYAALRTGRHKYVEWSDGDTEFYDLGVDPSELESRHLELTESQRFALAAKLHALQSCAGESCRTIEATAPLDRGRSRPRTGYRGERSRNR